MGKKTKLSFGIVGLGMVLCLVVILACYAIVDSYAEEKTFTDVNDIPETKFGLLLGTTPQTRIGRRPNRFFTYRIDAAEALYKAGKIHYIQVSGDGHSLDGVDETVCMRDSLIARGIPGDVIFRDGKGYRTYNSIVRAAKGYGVHSFTIISQRFHTERALYLAGHLGLDVTHAYGFIAKNSYTRTAYITYAREYLARVKMFLDILFSSPSSVPVDDAQPLQKHSFQGLKYDLK